MVILPFADFMQISLQISTQAQKQIFRHLETRSQLDAGVDRCRRTTNMSRRESIVDFGERSFVKDRSRAQSPISLELRKFFLVGYQKSIENGCERCGC